MRLLWEDRAWEDYLYWQTQDKKVLKRDAAREENHRFSSLVLPPYTCAGGSSSFRRSHSKLVGQSWMERI